MKKALISAAAATALLGAAGVAQAQVTAYGLFDISAGKSVAGDALGNDVGLNSGGNGGASEGNSTTRFGLKGSSDVGSGIKANFNYQAGIDGSGATNGGTTLFNRQAWAGLSGGFGEFRFGKQDSVPFQTFIGLDFNGASNGVSSAFNTSYGSNSSGIWGSVISARQSNSLQYMSPSLGGLTVQAGYVKAGSQDYVDGKTFDADDATNDEDDKSTWTGADDKDNKGVASLGLTYVVGPVTLAAAYQGSGVKDDNKGTDDFDETAAYAGFGAQYDFGAFKLKADYHKLDTINQVNFGAVTTVAGWSVGALYSINTDKSRTVVATKDVKTTGYEVFVNKEVLKNVYGYAEFGSATADEGVLFESKEDSAAGFAVGMILVF